MIAELTRRLTSSRQTRIALETAEGEGMVDRRNTPLSNGEDAWWRAHHYSQPWAGEWDYADVASAYRAGYNGYLRYGLDGATFAEAEARVRRDYENGNFWLRWDEVRPACLAAWQRMEEQLDPVPEN
jgi:hypothetical protein